MEWIIGMIGATAAMLAGFLAGAAWGRMMKRGGTAAAERRRDMEDPDAAQRRRELARRRLEYRNFLCYNGDACPDPAAAMLAGEAGGGKTPADVPLDDKGKHGLTGVYERRTPPACKPPQTLPGNQKGMAARAQPAGVRAQGKDENAAASVGPGRCQPRVQGRKG